MRQDWLSDLHPTLNVRREEAQQAPIVLQTRRPGACGSLISSALRIFFTFRFLEILYHIGDQGTTDKPKLFDRNTFEALGVMHVRVLYLNVRTEASQNRCLGVPFGVPSLGSNLSQQLLKLTPFLPTRYYPQESLGNGQNTVSEKRTR